MHDFDWKKHIIDCLESTEFCCLGTVDGENIWTNPVHFSWDEKCNLYCISLPNTRHMKNIAMNGKIAVSIFSTTQSTLGDLVGIQLEGRAEILQTREEIEPAFKYYYRQILPVARRADTNTADDFIFNPTWHLVKIIPEHMYYFDTRYFDEETKGRQEVPHGIDLS